MIDVRLAATNPEDSSLVPVSCNARGELATVAPKIEIIPNDLQVSGDLTVTGLINGSDGVGEPGPPGPQGPPGIGQLPPGAFDGAYLGWENGELVWFGTPIPPVTVTGFRPVIYTGNGGAQSIDCGFSPDLVWLKGRDFNSAHMLFDSVRGAKKRLVSNQPIAEATVEGVISFDSDGFVLGSDPDCNYDGKSHVAWCWSAGDTTVTNNDGTIESQVSSNGNFSIVKYQGTSANGLVGHGLSSAPKWVIVKNINSPIAHDWTVYVEELSNVNSLKLNDSAATNSTPTAWNSTSPTSTTFSLGSGNAVNESGTDYIAYAWAETPGASRFGEYAGNSGRQTITTGFKPSFVIIKSTVSGSWFMFDNARGASNALYANEASEEVDTGAVEFLDNGFQLLLGLPSVNISGENYVYASFANPGDAAFAQRQLRREARQEKRQQIETA